MEQPQIKLAAFCPKHYHECLGKCYYQSHVLCRPPCNVCYNDLVINMATDNHVYKSAETLELKKEN